MFHHIEGDVVALSPTRAILDVGGVGYELAIPLSTYRAVQDRPRVRLLVHFIVREDSQRLYGFESETERGLFRVVVGINGVGPAIALAVLSTIDVAEFLRVVDSGDTATLQRIKGVGRKLADRMLMELRDRLPATLPHQSGSGKGPEFSGGRVVGGRFGSGPAGEAARALEELGFQPKEAEERVGRALQALETADAPNQAAAGMTVEAILSRALRQG